MIAAIDRPMERATTTISSFAIPIRAIAARSYRKRDLYVIGAPSQQPRRMISHLISSNRTRRSCPIGGEPRAVNT